MKNTGRWFARKTLLPCILFLAGAGLFALNFNDNENPDTLAAKIVNAMSDEDALAQTFMFGWKDMQYGPSPLIQEWIKTRRIGGVKVFGWNTDDIEQLAKTIGIFQRYSTEGPMNIPLLIATDQEGGLVRHIRAETSKTPGAMAIGATGFPEDAYRSGYYIGRELSILGINMNFAPTADLFTNHNSKVIGPRSFGDDPVKVGVMAIAFAKGQLAAGIIPTAKHFPGHGDTALDSHGVLPLIDADFDTLWSRELVPYRMLSKEGIPAVMSGHIAFPKTAAKMIPASLSPYFLNDILRKKIGYNGLIITDDLAMNGAILSAGSFSAAAKQALLAGNDIIMVSQTPSIEAPVWTTLLQSMRSDPQFRECVRSAARRILTVKLRYLRSEKAPPFIPDLNNISKNIPDKDGMAFFQDLAARSVTYAGGKTGGLPLPASKAGKVLLAGQNSDFFPVGRFVYPKATGYWYTAPASPLLIEMAASADTIIFYLESNEGLEVLSALRHLGKRIIILSVLNPAHLKSLTWVDGAVAVYSDSYESLVAGFSAIAGSIDAQGTIPFSFEKK
jgi:beta-N-acetylhexosaminidase